MEGQDVCKGSTSEQADSKGSTNAHGNSIRFGPLMPQSANLDGEGFEKVLDPVHVPGLGAPKKRLHAKMKKTRTKGRCSYCHEADGHNQRTCAKLIEVPNMPQFNVFMCPNIFHGINNTLICRISKQNYDSYNIVRTVGQQVRRRST